MVIIDLPQKALIKTTRFIVVEEMTWETSLKFVKFA